MQDGELRELVTLACGCRFYRSHPDGQRALFNVEPCDEHEALSKLRPREMERYFGARWPPTEGILARAWRRVA